MKDLRSLHIHAYYCKFNIVPFDKVSEYLPSSLRFMRWDCFPFSSLPNTFQGKNLVELVIWHANIVQLWEDGEGKVLHKLRFLTFRSCSKLQTFDLRLAPNLEQLTIEDCYDFRDLHIPADHHSKLEEINLSHSKLRILDLGLTPNLKRLNLKNCNCLVEINAPVGYLKKLAFLNLSGCGRFESFVFDKQSQPAEAGSLSELHLIAKPKDVCLLHPGNSFPKFRFKCYLKEDPVSSFGNLEMLISLGLCACTNLENFSRSICSLRGLRKLTLEGSIPEVPRDLDQLECLEELMFSSTNIGYLPDSICKLKHLKSLELDSCWLLEKLPEDIGRVESLEKLILTDCRLLQDLPNSICKLKHLKSFKIKSCWLLKKLPEDIGRVESLEMLILTDCKLLLDIPNSICKMKCINSFDLRGCGRVVKLPEDIGCLESLKELNIEGTGMTRLPDSICKLKHLESFKIKSCWLLEKLPEDIGCLEGLKELNIEGTGITRLPDSLCKLKHLKSFKVKSCWHLEKLPEDLGRLQCLEELDLTECIVLRDIPKSICQMKCLINFQLPYCFLVEKIPEDIGSLKQLKELNIEGTGISHLPKSIFQLEGVRIVGFTWQLQSYGFTSMKQTSTYVSFSYIEK